MEFTFQSVVALIVLAVCHRQQLNALNHLVHLWKKLNLESASQLVNICYLSTEYAIKVFLVQMGGHSLDPLRKKEIFS